MAKHSEMEEEGGKEKRRRRGNEKMERVGERDRLTTPIEELHLQRPRAFLQARRTGLDCQVSFTISCTRQDPSG